MMRRACWIARSGRWQRDGLLATVVFVGAARAHAQQAETPDLVPPEAPVIEVRSVRKSRAQELEESARPIHVIELERARRNSADLGQVLARSPGLSVRREGGLGSTARISMAGLADEQIPVFVDGVPLELAGYPFGIANVPVTLLERVEVHRGVVPVRLGADALGGAIDLITDRSPRGASGIASYQGGSFDTHRLAGTARGYHAKSGLYARADAFFDTTRNNYSIRVDEASGPNNEVVPTMLTRRNDGYRAGAGTLEAGVINRWWAKRLLLRGFYGGLEKQLPNNLTMKAPYGKANSERAATGAVARFESERFHDITIAAIASYTRRTVGFEDLSECTYDWYGRCTRLLLPMRGETSNRPYDQHIRQDTLFGRVSIGYAPSPFAQVLLSSTASATRRTGEDKALTANLLDALEGRRDLVSVVSGLEHVLDAWEERVQNVLFVKDYMQLARSQDLQTIAGGFRSIARNDHRVGFGDGLRVRLTPEVFGKASYEWATRLPSPDQMFGDGVLISSNLRLRPEASHNFNLGPGFETVARRLGSFRGMANGFVRLSENQIALLTGADDSRYQNVADVRTLGFDTSAGWTAPGGFLLLDANTTWQSLRNVSKSGEYARYEGDPLPNRPYLFANVSAVVVSDTLFGEHGALSVGWYGSYVHEFLLGWQTLARDGAKLTVPSQFVQTLAATLTMKVQRRSLSSTVELNNLTGVRVYDYFGVQRPGRMFCAKLTFEI